MTHSDVTWLIHMWHRWKSISFHYVELECWGDSCWRCCCYEQMHINAATNCNTPRHTATHCNTLQHTATHRWNCLSTTLSWNKCTSTLQQTATHCNALQHPATPCNTQVKLSIGYAELERLHVFRNHQSLVAFLQYYEVNSATRCNTL